MPIPLLAEFAMSQAPALLSLFGKDPQSRQREELMKLFDPRVLQMLTQEVFRNVQSSPGYMGARRSAFGASNAFAGNINNNFARMGLNDTGVGAIASAGARSSLQSMLSKIDTSAFDQASGIAQFLTQGRAGALRDNPYGASRFGSAFGKGLEAFAPILREYLKNRVPRQRQAPDFSRVDVGAF